MLMRVPYVGASTARGIAAVPMCLWKWLRQARAGFLGAGQGSRVSEGRPVDKRGGVRGRLGVRNAYHKSLVTVMEDPSVEGRRVWAAVGNDKAALGVGPGAPGAVVWRHASVCAWAMRHIELQLAVQVGHGRCTRHRVQM